MKANGSRTTRSPNNHDQHPEGWQEAGGLESRTQKGKPATFNVIAEGSILTRTSVAINGRKGALTDIEEGKSLIIYWQPDAKNEGARFARKIDVVDEPGRVAREVSRVELGPGGATRQRLFCLDLVEEFSNSIVQGFLVFSEGV